MVVKRKAEAGQAQAAVQYNTIKVPLYPTAAQEELFQKTFSCCWHIWNQMLADHEEFYYVISSRSIS